MISLQEPRIFCYAKFCVQLLQREILWDHVELSSYLMNILRVQTTLLSRFRFFISDLEISGEMKGAISA